MREPGGRYRSLFERNAYGILTADIGTRQFVVMLIHPPAGCSDIQ